jgi:nitrate reductase delta subunit
MQTHKTWQILGLALGYPDAAFRDAVPELVAVLQRERALPPTTLATVLHWLTEVGERPLLDAQERYSATFDGGRFLSLHLFEHVHGDGKDRGRALSELSARYLELGVALGVRETPDYLPALCELATVCGARGVAVLQEAGPVIERLAQALAERQSPYVVLVRAVLEALGTAPVNIVASETTLPPLDLDELDKEWEDSPIEFGVAAAHDALVPIRRSKDAPSLVTAAS